jgi:hypothetical protein
MEINKSLQKYKESKALKSTSSEIIVPRSFRIFFFVVIATMYVMIMSSIAEFIALAMHKIALL